MKLSISILGLGLTWPRWKQLVNDIEEMGFAGLYLADHFTMYEPPNLASLELMTALTYLASHSQRLHFGSMVAPLSFRDPVFLARQAMAVDDLSGGRMILGVGAGWMEREHTMFGYNLGDVSTRLDRLEEGLEVITRLIRSNEPVTFEGQFYQLQEAQLLPRPERVTPILIGGIGPKRTIPMVSRYADIWNCQSSPEMFRDRSALLDDLLHSEGRLPGDVKRTVLATAICWRDQKELVSRMSHMRRNFPHFAHLSTEEIVELYRANWQGIMGSPEFVVERLNAYASAGAEEAIILWFGVNDIEGLEAIAEQVLPYFSK